MTTADQQAASARLWRVLRSSRERILTNCQGGRLCLWPQAAWRSSPGGRGEGKLIACRPPAGPNNESHLVQRDNDFWAAPGASPGHSLAHQRADLWRVAAVA